MGSLVDLSVIIVTYKSKEYISRCIQSVFEATQGLNSEIIIVDNDSADGLGDLIRIKFPKVTLIDNNKNEGFARGVNRGASMASGRYINILNPDTQLYPDTLKILLDFFEKQPLCCLAGGRTINGAGECIPSCRSLPHIANLISYPLRMLLQGKNLLEPKLFLLDIWEQNKTIDLAEYNGYITGACILTRLDFFKKMGMFDERFFLAAEDSDFGLRLRKAGFHAFFVKEASLVHFEGRSATRNPQSRFFTIDSYLRYVHKNFSFFNGEVYKTLFLFFVLGEAVWASLRMKRERAQVLLYSLRYIIRYWSVDPPDIS